MYKRKPAVSEWWLSSDPNPESVQRCEKNQKTLEGHTQTETLERHLVLKPELMEPTEDVWCDDSLLHHLMTASVSSAAETTWRFVVLQGVPRSSEEPSEMFHQFGTECDEMYKRLRCYSRRSLQARAWTVHVQPKIYSSLSHGVRILFVVKDFLLCCGAH